MAEWSIAAVLKTVEPRGSGGSNPSLSANQITSRAHTASAQKPPEESLRRLPAVPVNRGKNLFFLANRHIPCGEFSRRRQCEA